MKRILLVLFFFFFASAASEAQTTFSVTILWDRNVATDEVTQYNLVMDGIATIIPMSACDLTTCHWAITITPGTHNLTLSATNQWGTSPTTPFSFSATLPGAARNIRVQRTK